MADLSNLIALQVSKDFEGLQNYHTSSSFAHTVCTCLAAEDGEYTFIIYFASLKLKSAAGSEMNYPRNDISNFMSC